MNATNSSQHSRRGLVSLLVLGLVVGIAGVASAQIDRQEVLPIGAPLKHFAGTQEPDPGWNDVGFTESAEWKAGNSPIGYGDGPPDITLATTIVGMQNTYLTHYVRQTFDVEDIDRVSVFRLIARYDDGFIAYVNGQEVHRASMPAGVATKDTAASEHELTAGTASRVLQAAQLASILVEGENVFAAEIHNTNLGSSDLIWEPRVLLDLLPPADPEFVRGSDCDDSPGLDIGDPIYLLRWQFGSFYDEPGCPKACDMDDSGVLNLSDAIFALNYLFQAGSPFPEPYPAKGLDPTDDDLNCDAGLPQ